MILLNGRQRVQKKDDKIDIIWNFVLQSRIGHLFDSNPEYVPTVIKYYWCME